MWLIKPSCKYKTTANLQKIFEKMLAGNVKNHNLFKNGFWYKSKKTPHWSHDWWGVEKNMFN